MNLQHLTLWAGYRDHSEEDFNPSKLSSEAAGDVDSSVKTLRHLTTLPQLTTLHLVAAMSSAKEYSTESTAFSRPVRFPARFFKQIGRGMLVFRGRQGPHGQDERAG